MWHRTVDRRCRGLWTSTTRSCVLWPWQSTQDEVRTGRVVVPGLDKSDDVQLPIADPLLDVGAFVGAHLLEHSTALRE